MAFNCPRIRVPLVSKMRLTATDVLEGCTKLTVSCARILKLCQSSDNCWLDCVTVVVASDCVMAPVPEDISPPVGLVWEMDEKRQEKTATKLGMDFWQIALVLDTLGITTQKIDL